MTIPLRLLRVFVNLLRASLLQLERIAKFWGQRDPPPLPHGRLMVVQHLL
jgi:hypothetical protein